MMAAVYILALNWWSYSPDLGLHLDCSVWKIPKWERSLRKRLAWALFMQYKWEALIHGRPSLIHREDWAVRPVETRDFPETAQDDDNEEGSSEIEKGRLTFVYLILLTDVLADILEVFFTLRSTNELEAERENAMTITLEKANPIQLRLKEWYSTLPDILAVSRRKQESSLQHVS